MWVRRERARGWEWRDVRVGEEEGADDGECTGEDCHCCMRVWEVGTGQLVV